MSRAHIVLMTLLAFIAGAVLGYAVIFGFWELAGIHDRDGGGGMAMAYVFAPAGALVTGTAAAASVARRLIRRRNAAPAPSSDQTGQDQRRLRAVLGVISGLAFGLVAATAAQSLLRPLIFDSRVAFLLYENAHELLIPLGGVIGFVTARLWRRA